MVVDDVGQRILSRKGWTTDFDRGIVWDNMLTAKEEAVAMNVPPGSFRIAPLTFPFAWVKPWTSGVNK